MMRRVIAITENEVARIDAASQTTLCTFGLINNIAIVIRSDKGATLMHITPKSELNLILGELILYKNSNASISLYKWHKAEGELEAKINTFLFKCMIPNVAVQSIMTPEWVPFGVLLVNSNGVVPLQPDFLVALGARATDSPFGPIEYGPIDFQLRTYQTQLKGFLNYDTEQQLEVMFDKDEWQHVIHLSEQDLRLFKYLSKFIDNEDILKQAINKIIANDAPAYKSRFGVVKEMLLPHMDDKFNLKLVKMNSGFGYITSDVILAHRSLFKLLPYVLRKTNLYCQAKGLTLEQEAVAAVSEIQERRAGSSAPAPR